MTAIRKERCPKCEELGKDRTGDNLAIYQDGHKFCFSCGYHEAANGITRFKHREQTVISHNVTLPIDICFDYPDRALQWISQYELTKNDLISNRVVWSEQNQRLIFPVYEGGSLLAWQGRWFGSTKAPKWFGRGNLRDTFHILGKGEQLIITEDIVSAIKVSKCGVMAMPIFGSFVGLQRFKRLYSLYHDSIWVRVWLDPDKASKAACEAKLGRLCGLHSSAVLTNADPKEHSYSEIKTILTT